MSKLKINGLVPKLRFPEFAGEWEDSILGFHCNITTGKLDANAMVENGEYRFYTCAKDYYYIDNYAFETDALLISGNGANVGYIHHYKGKFNAYQRTYILDQFDENIIFIKCYLERSLYKRILTEKKEGNIPYIVMSTLSKMTILIPKQEEQQKIATCLSSIDASINAQRKRLVALKAHKKGLMQQLFPAEGESLPKLRFPEFEGEWRNELFKKIYSFKITNSLSRENLNYKQGTIKNIHYGDIHTKFSTLFNIEKETVPYIKPSVSLEKIKQESFCIEGDMIFADASEDVDDIGKCIEIKSLNSMKLLSGLHTLLARQLEKKFIIGFGGYLFKSNRIREQIKKESQGAKVLGISAGRLSTIDVAYPTKKEEQQKIASCLISIDVLIETQNKKLELLRAHKKGLMQQLFPNTDKVVQ